MIAKAAHSTNKKKKKWSWWEFIGSERRGRCQPVCRLFSLALVQQRARWCSLTPLLFRQIRSLGPIPTLPLQLRADEREKSSSLGRPDGSLFLARARRQHTLPARSITTFLTYLTPIAPVHRGMQQLAYQTGRWRQRLVAQHVHFNPRSIAI